MGKMIKQFRFYGNNNNDNYPGEVDINSLKTGFVFQNYTPIISLGVQGMPGTKFYVNGSKFPVILGYSGIYEIKSNESSPINSLSFDIESLINISSNPSGYLIIDIIYEGDNI